MDEKTRKLRRMAMWLIAVFSTIFAITMALLWQLTGGAGLNSVWMAFERGWLIYVVVGAFCLITYYAYKFYLDRKK